MPTKACFKCKREQDVEEFYRHPRMADGRLGKCKECTKADVAANRVARIEHYREYDRRRFHENPRRRAAHAASLRRTRERYPEKVQAWYLVGNAIRDGRLVRQPCEVCGSTKSEAHHDDYSRPLDVRWLCKLHHEEAHHADSLLYSPTP